MVFEVMFQLIQIGKLIICNCVFFIVYVEVYVIDGGMIIECYVKYYEEKVKGGIGLVICGGFLVVVIDSLQQWWSLVNLFIDWIILYFQNLVDVMYKYGVKIMIQIIYMGCCLCWDGYYWLILMLLLGICELVYCVICKIIEVEEIWWVIGNYVQVVCCVKEGGLDGVELFVVYQYMIDQFWSLWVNKCIDEWGGSFEGCMKFGFEVFKVVCVEVGEDFCVGMCICGDEFYLDGLFYEDMKQIVKYYSDIGMFDFIGVVGFGCDIYNILVNVIFNMIFLLELFLYLVVGIKEVVDVLVLYVQNIKDLNQVMCIFEGGYVDMVGMICVYIVDLYLIVKIKMGQVDQIKQCVGVNYCIDCQYQGLDVLCIQNVVIFCEYMGVLYIIEKFVGLKCKVVVVGGGLVGMEVVCVVVECGYDVILFEKKEQFGGQIIIVVKVL